MMLPQEWEDMQQKRVKVVELKPEMPEYQAVQRMFRQTCASFTIEKVNKQILFLVLLGLVSISCVMWFVFYNADETRSLQCL